MKTLFDEITSSYEKLAEKFVVKEYDFNSRCPATYYRSILIAPDDYDGCLVFNTKAEAIKQTIEKLKEEYIE